MLSASSKESSVLKVLSDRFLITYIAKFQLGLPQIYCDLSTIGDRRYRHIARTMPLWRVVVEKFDLALVQRLYRLSFEEEYFLVKRVHCSEDLPSLAVRAGRLDVLQWLHLEPRANQKPWDGGLLNLSLGWPHNDIALWLIQNRPEACKYNEYGWMLRVGDCGSLALVQAVISSYPYALHSGVLTRPAAGHGRLDLVKWIHDTYSTSEAWSPSVMNEAASGGHLAIVQFFHANRSEGCTTRAMDSAAQNGHLEVVKFLHHHRSEGCTTQAMDGAAAKNKLDVIKFLHEHRTEGCTRKALEVAANKHHFEVVRYLHEHCGLREPINLHFLSYYEHVPLFDYLLENNLIRERHEAFQWVCSRGFLGCARLLHEKYNESHAVDQQVVNVAIRFGRLDLVQFLQETLGVVLDEQSLDNARLAQDDKVVEYVQQHLNGGKGC